MLKITEINRTENAVTLKLEGRIAEDFILEIKTVCDAELSNGYHLTLDMSDVCFIERRAVLFFQNLQSLQIALTNCSLFLSEQLRKGDFYANRTTRK